MLDLQLPEAKTRVDLVVEQIRAFIQKSGMKPGDRLPSEPLFIENLRVSRGILREAIRRLETLGILTVEHGRGMFVGTGDNLLQCARLFRTAMTIGCDDMEQFTDFRRMIECYAVRRAAARATPEDLAHLEELCERMDPKRSSYEEMVRADCAFHLKIVDIAGNGLVRHSMAILQEFLVAEIWHTSCNASDREANPVVHREIVQALRDRDANRAEALISRHMDLCDTILAQLKASGIAVTASVPPSSSSTPGLASPRSNTPR